MKLILALAVLAATVLPANTPVISSTASSYSFSTGLQYWSAVAVRPTAGVDFDLQLLDAGTGGLLAGSYWGTGQTDVILVNSTAGYRPLGNYLANVTKYSGSGQYSVMFWELRQVMPVPTDPKGNTSTALPINFDRPVFTTMVYLQQNQGFRVYMGSQVEVLLAGSTPGVPSTGIRTRSQMQGAYVIADHVPAGNGSFCRYFKVPTAGWYSVVLIWTSPLTPPPYNGGSAVFPQRYDPSLGDTTTSCPVPTIP